MIKIVRYECRRLLWNKFFAGLLLVLPLRGEALAMEADVRELRRLQSRLPGARMVLVDCGLTEDARGLAQYLADREKRGELVDAAEFHLG